MKKHLLWSTRPSRPLMNCNRIFSEVTKHFISFFKKIGGIRTVYVTEVSQFYICSHSTVSHSNGGECN